jgi:hypothetical protein
VAARNADYAKIARGLRFHNTPISAHAAGGMSGDGADGGDASGGARARGPGAGGPGAGGRSGTLHLMRLTGGETEENTCLPAGV